MHTTGVPIDPATLHQMPLFQSLELAGVEQIARGGWVVNHQRGTRVLGRGEFL